MEVILDYIWSPWRMKYIQNKQREEGCIFCNRLQHTNGVENLIVYRGKYSYVILNRYPYTSGHLMVVSFEHQPTLELLTQEARAEMMELLSYSLEVLKVVYQPHGFNIGANIGEAGGAGIAEHVHLHVVPRWYGDTNFISSVGETRILPEDLSETYRRVKDAWKK